MHYELVLINMNRLNINVSCDLNLSVQLLCVFMTNENNRRKITFFKSKCAKKYVCGEPNG